MIKTKKKVYAREDEPTTHGREPSQAPTWRLVEPAPHEIGGAKLTSWSIYFSESKVNKFIALFILLFEYKEYVISLIIQ